MGLLDHIVAWNPAWVLMDHTVLRLSQALLWRRQGLLQRRRADELIERVPRLRSRLVQDGPFRGLEYPSSLSAPFGSVQRLVGTYERELAPTIEAVCTQPYTAVVDIGCAEGYYAVGLARRLPAVRVFAFDTDPSARAACAHLATANGVSERVIIGTHCDEATLRALPLGERALVISDCEGYEAELFSETVAALLRPHDVIIELHDFVDPTISGRVRSAFASTHLLESVQSIDDLVKMRAYMSSGFDELTLAERFEMVREHRPTQMEWLLCWSRRDWVS